MHNVRCQYGFAEHHLLDVDTNRRICQPAQYIRTAVAEVEMTLRMVREPRLAVFLPSSLPIVANNHKTEPYPFTHDLQR
jgi:hypothetical protein